MKTISAILLTVIALTGFKRENSGNAQVQKVQGIDVYVMSEPTRPYEVIKNDLNGVVLTCKGTLNFPINQAAKTEGAQGVIIYFPQSDKFSIIKYKD